MGEYLTTKYNRESQYTKLTCSIPKNCFLLNNAYVNLIFKILNIAGPATTKEFFSRIVVL